ncbi:MAG: hypothetical protein JWQ28_1443 [Pedobacter sp.]|jgi:hypothetical protein|nr:hypothetical protein [Pedobacter sp.]
MENPIPSQEHGNKLDIIEKATFKSSEQACEFYEVAKERLVDVNHWAEISNLPSATFHLCDSTGSEVNRHVKLGDYFKINIPAPGNSTGDGFDWVKVEYIEEQQVNGSDIMSIRVRPAPNPTTPDPSVAHFFSDRATSTFQIRRVDKEVLAEVHGRNEEPNTDTGSLIDNARNSVVGLGATLGMSVPQWKGLVAGLVKVY